MDPYFQRKKRFEAVLRPMGLWDGFAAMPRPLQEMFWKTKLHDPAVVFDDAAAKAAESAPRGLRHAAERYLRTATVTVDGGLEMPVRDFVGVVTGVMCLYQWWTSPELGPDAKSRARMPESYRSFISTAGPLMERCHAQHLQAAWNAMYGRVMLALVQASRLDKQLFTARVELGQDDRGRHATRLIVCATPPQTRRVTLDGSLRPMYRAAKFTGGTTDVGWVSWEGRLVPGGDASRQYPVYVQSHALRRLHERVQLPHVGPWLDPWLGDSLAEPNVVERQGGDLLVEYRIRQWRLGYLIATRARDENGQICLAVRTFKLMTMGNMPEARKLERKLKLSRMDVNWLNLHDLKTFTHSDLRNDPVLRPLLEACGFGPLFELADAQNFAPQPSELAAEVRRYLRLAA